MQLRQPLAQAVAAATGGLAVPLLAKVGAAVIAAGLLVDLAAHAVLHPAHDELIGSFPVGEHLAHLVVVVGMALVLAGVVADGVSTQRRLARHQRRLDRHQRRLDRHQRRLDRQEGIARHAVR